MPPLTDPISSLLGKILFSSIKYIKHGHSDIIFAYLSVIL